MVEVSSEVDDSWATEDGRGIDYGRVAIDGRGIEYGRGTDDSEMVAEIMLSVCETHLFFNKLSI